MLGSIEEEEELGFFLEISGNQQGVLISVSNGNWIRVYVLDMNIVLI